jgi:dihydrofolate reductase
MKVFIYMATTINGMIKADVPYKQWISDVSWHSYLKALGDMDIAVVGAKTYKIMTTDEFAAGVPFVVLTHNSTELQQRGKVSFSDKPPQELVRDLETRGYKRVGVLGGAEVVSSFLNAGVVDELFIDIEGVISGGKKNLVLPDTTLTRFELVGMQRLDNTTVQLRYKVLPS